MTTQSARDLGWRPKIHAFMNEWIRPDGTRFRSGVQFYDGAWRFVYEEVA
jgi:hypothetical protein